MHLATLNKFRVAIRRSQLDEMFAIKRKIMIEALRDQPEEKIKESTLVELYAKLCAADEKGIYQILLYLSQILAEDDPWKYYDDTTLRPSSIAITNFTQKLASKILESLLPAYMHSKQPNSPQTRQLMLDVILNLGADKHTTVESILGIFLDGLSNTYGCSAQFLIENEESRNIGWIIGNLMRKDGISKAVEEHQRFEEMMAEWIQSLLLHFKDEFMKINLIRGATYFFKQTDKKYKCIIRGLSIPIHRFSLRVSIFKSVMMMLSSADLSSIFHLLAFMYENAVCLLQCQQKQIQKVLDRCMQAIQLGKNSRQTAMGLLIWSLGVSYSNFQGKLQQYQTENNEHLTDMHHKLSKYAQIIQLNKIYVVKYYGSKIMINLNVAQTSQKISYLRILRLLLSSPFPTTNTSPYQICNHFLTQLMIQDFLVSMMQIRDQQLRADCIDVMAQIVRIIQQEEGTSSNNKIQKIVTQIDLFWQNQGKAGDIAVQFINKYDKHSQ